MAKKVSKRSRAARRGLIDDEGEARDLSNLPKSESDDVKKSIIRTTIKNENLLQKKMENSKVKKTMNKKKTNSLKHKLERSDKLSGVLSTKIEQSIARAKYVQSSRKAGWDLINKTITIKNNMVEENNSTPTTTEKTEEEMEQDAEDEYVKNFFDGEKEESKDEEDKPVRPNSANAFALLEETEA
ncbi:Alb1-domain-containing protein [Scheffersomyces xylosifermentans]|uniref:Alb1-domain-containing protein n=1 Tax=Scheffersomyces xylosifermentans TaxID=1304137 RepID=UPI00315D4181